MDTTSPTVRYSDTTRGVICPRHPGDEKEILPMSDRITHLAYRHRMQAVPNTRKDYDRGNY